MPKNRTTGAEHAGPGGRDQHYVLHQENSCLHQQVEGRDVWVKSGGLQTGQGQYLLRQTQSRGDRFNYQGD